MIRCGKCNQFKDADLFSGRRSTYCKPCKREYNREHYKRNRERILAQKQETDRRERRLKRQKDYYRENHERVDQAIKDWQRRHPEVVAGYYQKGRVKRRDRLATAFIEPIDRDVLWRRDGGICGICQNGIEGDFHIDHVIPLSQGGEHSYRNTQIAHPKCNQRKWAHTNFILLPLEGKGEADNRLCN